MVSTCVHGVVGGRALTSRGNCGHLCTQKQRVVSSRDLQDSVCRKRTFFAARLSRKEDTRHLVDESAIGIVVGGVASIVAELAPVRGAAVAVCGGKLAPAPLGIRRQVFKQRNVVI